MKNLIKGQRSSLEKAIRICLYKAGKKDGQQHINPKSLASTLTMSYLGLIYKAIEDGSIYNIEENEKAIDELVDFIFAGAKNRVS